jgi:hypothetical protein
LIVLVVMWTGAVRHPSRLEISRQAITSVSAQGKVTTLSRQSGDELRIVAVGGGRYRSRGMTLTRSSTVIPLPFFSLREVREQATACGWRFRSTRRAR